MVQSIEKDTVAYIFKVTLSRSGEPVRRRQTQAPAPARLDLGTRAGPAGGKPSVQQTARKVGRNAPCPCGSGKKYKHCCGKLG